MSGKSMNWWRWYFRIESVIEWLGAIVAFLSGILAIWFGIHGEVGKGLGCAVVTVALIVVLSWQPTFEIDIEDDGNGGVKDRENV